MPSPSRRRSTNNTDPPIRANPIKWMLAMRGKIHGEPRIADSSEEYCSHSKNVKNDIPAFLWRSRRTTRKPIQDCGLRLFVAVEPIHLIRNHASQHDQDGPQHKRHTAAHLAPRGGTGSESPSVLRRSTVS